MKQAITVFNYHRDEVRVVMRDGKPWWVARDVCGVLGIRNSRDALSRLDDDEKNTVALTDGNRGNPNVAIVNESGLYTLILSSRKPEAKAFKRWITHEVLPQIRETGIYSADDDTLIARALVVATQKLEALKPMAEKYEYFMKADNSLSFLEAGKVFRTGRNRLFELLRNEGVLTKRTGHNGRYTNVPYQRYEKYFDVRVSEYKGQDGTVYVTTQTFVTPHGMDWIRDKFFGGEQ